MARQRYNEQRSTAGIVEGSRSSSPPEAWLLLSLVRLPPTVVFVDLAGYTWLTEQRGDEVHADPVIERDLDLFGRTVNLASRIAEAAGPGEVLVSEAGAGAVDRPGMRFEPTDPAVLKRIPEPVPLFRVLAE